MAEKKTNNNQQLMTREDADELDVIYSKKNEANINFGGIKLNIDLIEFGRSIKTLKEKRAEKKTIKQKQKMNKTAEYIIIEDTESRKKK